MIHEVSGDILLSTAQAIAHGVAPNDPFHSGLALALREKWPAMYKDFRHYCQTSHPKSGTTWAWAGAGEHGPVQIVALLTQEGGYDHGGKPGPAHANFINHALKELHAWAEREKIQSLALPRLCTGVGGMSWEAVAPLVRQHLGAMKIPVYVYTTFHTGMAAQET
ncbi:MAG: macro domain-containing protein [Phycisphaerae bacterium]|nr:macro domain-containing protein [Phycisphaerae bacterium]